MLAEIATVSGAGGKVRTARAVHTWSTTAGVVDQAGKQASGTGDPRAALSGSAIREPSVLVMRDLHAFLGDDRRPADRRWCAPRDLASELQAGRWRGP